MLHEFEFEIAVSFLGENRAYVDSFVFALKQYIPNVFYDKYYEIDMWGENLYTYLHNVFSHKSRHWIVFVSEKTDQKNWTKHELESIYDAIINSDMHDHRLMLPVRFDKNDVLPAGIKSNIKYLNAFEHSPENLAKLVCEKLRISIDNNILPSLQNEKNDIDSIYHFLADGIKNRIQSIVDNNRIFIKEEVDILCCTLINKNNMSYEMIIRNHGIMGSKSQLSIWDGYVREFNSDETYTALICLNNNNHTNATLKLINLGFLVDHDEHKSVISLDKEILIDLLWQKLHFKLKSI